MKRITIKGPNTNIFIRKKFWRGSGTEIQFQKVKGALQLFGLLKNTFFLMYENEQQIIMASAIKKESMIKDSYW